MTSLDQCCSTGIQLSSAGLIVCRNVQFGDLGMSERDSFEEMFFIFFFNSSAQLEMDLESNTQAGEMVKRCYFFVPSGVSGDMFTAWINTVRMLRCKR